MVRYIHSGDHVEAEQAGSKLSAHAEPQESCAGAGQADSGPDLRADPTESANGGEAPVSGMETADEGVDVSAETEETSGGDAASGGGQSNEQTGSQTADSDNQAEDEESAGGMKGFLSSLFSGDSASEESAEADASGKQDAEASAELGTDSGGAGSEDSAAVEGEANNAPDAGADIGVDAGATGYGDHDLQDSDGAGTPEQEGPASQQPAEPAVQGSSETEESLAAEKSTNQAEAPRDGGSGKQETQDEASAGTAEAENQTSGGQSQDAEASGELGRDEPDSGKRGFFARLFGDDPDEEEEEETAADAENGAQGKQQAEAEAGADAPEEPEKSKQDPKQAQPPAAEKVDPLQKKRDNEYSDSLEQSIIYWQGNDKIPERLEDAKNTLTEVLGLGSSFDIVFREMSFGGRKAALLCISGFTNDTIIDEILKRLTYLTPTDISADVFASFMSEYIPHVQVEKGELLSESVNKVLSGMSVFFIEGENQVIIMDTRSYPSRNPDEPSIERVVRGARDGFTETLLSNVALVRRRIRDPGLKYEMHQVGRRTRTDVCVAYIDDIVDKTQVQAVTDKIKSIDIDGIPLADKQLEEAIVGKGWNPYPLVRYSERPDIVASHLLEGRVVIFVDTSPSVIVLPTTFFDLCQHAEENRQTPFMGTYLRWVRFIGVFASMFLLPLWMLLVLHPELKPAMLDFIGPQKTAHIPLLAQFLIVELGVDLLRMAAVHTPTPLGSAMGLIAAILVGDIAVQTGLFVNEVVLYMAVASIGMFATPSYELGLANRIVRLALLIAVAAFQVPGFMIGTTLLIVLLTTHRSYNSSYLWPFIPFNAKALGAILVRQPVLSSKTRPSFNKTRDNTRMPPVQDNER